MGTADHEDGGDMRFIIGLVLIAHGLAHSLGFFVPWRIGPGKSSPYNTTILNGSIDLGDIGIRVMGILWLVPGLAFVVAGIGVMAASSWGGIVTLDAAMFSLILSIIGWPDSRVGVFINVAILAYLGLVGRLR
jgi:hypothetical protein